MTPAELAATLRRLNDEAEREKSSNSRVAHLDRIVLLGDLAPAIPDLIESAAELSDVHHTSCSSFYDEDWGCNCQASKLRAALSAMCEKGGAA